MRVIAGSAKSIRLKTPEGLNTRPTQDRIKETLFNMIHTDMPGCTFLDLFSGSGGIGIEAASRGARKVYMFEADAKVCSIIKQNLQATHLEEKCTLIQGRLPEALSRVSESDAPFDYIFMDPPYEHDLEKAVLLWLKKSKLIDSYTTIIVEASLKTDFDDLEDMGYVVARVKKYKTNKHVFINLNEG